MTTPPASGRSDLADLLRSLRPERREGEFVVLSVSTAVAGELAPLAMIVEGSSTTVIVRRADADDAGLPYDFIAAWITLTVHSSLAAVGLTAAVSTALTAAGISCNVLAGYFHDHLLVPVERAEEALAVLRAMAG